MTVEETQAKLKELIPELAPGEEVIVTESQQPVATLVGKHSPQRKPRVPGNCKGMIILLVEDNEHLDDFAEYM